MPTPFMCHECDSPTMNKDGICDNCIEPTTADEHNKDFIQYRDTGDENVVYISDVNKEIAKEWINLKDRTRQERIALEKEHEERKKITKEDKIKYKPNKNWEGG